MWFNGPQEGDVNIWILLSRLPIGGKEWSVPIKVSEMSRFSVQNPVLHWIPNTAGGDTAGGGGRLVLMHTAQPAKRGQAEGRVVMRVSDDRGLSWSANPVPLLTRRGSFIRHGLIPAQTGKGLLLPVYFTPHGMGNTAGQGAVLLRSEDESGLRWREIAAPAPAVATETATGGDEGDGGDRGDGGGAV